MSLWCYVYIAGYQVDVIHVGQWNNTPCKLHEDWMHCKAEEKRASGSPCWILAAENRGS